MTEKRFARNLEAIGAEFTLRQTASGNWEAVSPSGESLALAHTETYARQGAEAEYERRRQGAYRGLNQSRLGNVTRDIVL